MFRDRERPEMREPHGSIHVQLPRRLIDQLNRLAETRRDPFRTFTQARSQIIAELLDRALQPVATTTSALSEMKEQRP
jgi:hypothetical protein